MYNVRMPSIRLEDLTPFGRWAVKLDQEFAELDRAGAQLSRAAVDSDSGLDEAVKILNRAARQGESLAATMQEFAKSLQEARDRADAAAQVIGERARLVQRRRQEQDELEGKFARLKEEVKAAGASLAGSGGPAKGEPSEDDKSRIAAELQRLQAPLTGFIEAARAIKAEAARGRFKRLERQADSMIDSLQATRAKIARALAK